MRNIEELKEQLEAIESVSWSQLSPDMPKPAPSLLRRVVELLEVQQKEIAELKDTVAYHDNVIRGIQNVEKQKWEQGYRGMRAEAVKTLRMQGIQLHLHTDKMSQGW